MYYEYVSLTDMYVCNSIPTTGYLVHTISYKIVAISLSWVLAYYFTTCTCVVHISLSCIYQTFAPVYKFKTF